MRAIPLLATAGGNLCREGWELGFAMTFFIDGSSESGIPLGNFMERGY